jgi:pimeloyl-ACP methyl ester carboxylesterase
VRRAFTVGSLILAACASQPVNSVLPTPSAGRAAVDGYELAYECHGEGSPTVILEGGLGASGLDEFAGFIDEVAATTHVCTYDRAGVGVSDPRPAGDHVTAGLTADDLHRLLSAIGVPPPYVLVGHPYGGDAGAGVRGSLP